MKSLAFISGFITGSIILSVCMGAVPKPVRIQPKKFENQFSVPQDGTSNSGLGSGSAAVTDDTALYQSLSEIEVRPEKSMDYDQDLKHLSQLETRYHERVKPLNAQQRMASPIQRISHTKYQYRSRVKSKSKTSPRQVKAKQARRMAPPVKRSQAVSMGVPARTRLVAPVVRSKKLKSQSMNSH